MGRPVVDIGDISNRVELRRRLECKPFSYFLNDVWPESDVRNLTRDVPYMGEMHNVITQFSYSLNNAHWIVVRYSM